jgi:hypothetical protein
MPAINSYFAIYTLEGMAQTHPKRGLNWDLHATATDRTQAISHARMLALQPGVTEVHVKQVTEDLTSGLVSVRDVKRCKRTGTADAMIKAGAVLMAVSVTLALKLIF